MTTPEGVSKHAEPRTLAEVHHTVASIRPPQKAPLGEWLAYHQQSAALYAEVAEIDRGHHHEALAMAERERQSAEQIKAQISSQRLTYEEGQG
jgi:hypothetical protein